MTLLFLLQFSATAITTVQMTRVVKAAHVSKFAHAYTAVQVLTVWLEDTQRLVNAIQEHAAIHGLVAIETSAL